MKICTYNIHRAIGTEKAPNIQRIISVLKEIDADIIALQEVSFALTKNLDLPTLLTTELKVEFIEGPTMNEAQGSYGNAVLTKIPIKKVEKLDISVTNREPRGAISLLFDYREKSYQFIATHLGLRPFERRLQIEQLLKKLEPEAAVKILAGDLNEWFSWGRPLKWLKKEFGPVTPLATFPAYRPLFALDRIWVNPGKEVIKLWVHKSKLARISSDHLPLVAMLR